jgi:hypothetical protein
MQPVSGPPAAAKPRMAVAENSEACGRRASQGLLRAPDTMMILLWNSRRPLAPGPSGAGPERKPEPMSRKTFEFLGRSRAARPAAPILTALLAVAATACEPTPPGGGPSAGQSGTQQRPPPALLRQPPPHNQHRLRGSPATSS